MICLLQVCAPEQVQRHERPFSSKSVLVISMRVAHRLGIYDRMKDWAQDGQYNHPSDWLLCHTFPEEEHNCREFYADRGERLSRLYSRRVVHRMDKTCAVCLMESARRLQC